MNGRLRLSLLYKCTVPWNVKGQLSIKGQLPGTESRNGSYRSTKFQTMVLRLAEVQIQRVRGTKEYEVEE